VPSNEVTVLNADSRLAQPQQLAQILTHTSAWQFIPDPRGARPAANRMSSAGKGRSGHRMYRQELRKFVSTKLTTNFPSHRTSSYARPADHLPSPCRGAPDRGGSRAPCPSPVATVRDVSLGTAMRRPEPAK
jgi:hypothetical protein